jgi:ribosomal protein L39E
MVFIYIKPPFLSIGETMSRNKPLGKKLKMAAAGKKRSAPRWADIRKFSLKRARSRRIRVRTRNWRKDKLKI